MKKKLVLYGCGQVGREWLRALGKEKVWAFTDSDSQKVGLLIDEIPVISLEELKRQQESVVVYISVSPLYKDEIYRKLKEVHLEHLVVGNPYLDRELYILWNASINTKTCLEGRNALLKEAVLKDSKIGYASYVGVNTRLINVSIGRYSSIGPNVKVIRGQHPTRRLVSTHPIFYSTQQTIRKSYVEKNIFEEFRFTPNGYTVEIGNDVWIGANVLLMEGIVIGDGAIIAAGANVVKDVPPYAIVGGNPARVIRYRFAAEDIEFLQGLQWWNKGEDWIDANAGAFADIEILKSKVR